MTPAARITHIRSFPPSGFEFCTQLSADDKFNAYMDLTLQLASTQVSLTTGRGAASRGHERPDLARPSDGGRAGGQL
jgi:hypothetical protein